MIRQFFIIRVLNPIKKFYLQVNIFEQEIEQIREQTKIREVNLEEEIAVLKEQVRITFKYGHPKMTSPSEIEGEGVHLLFDEIRQMGVVYFDQQIGALMNDS